VVQSKAKKMIIDHHAIHDYTMKADFSFIDEKATSTAGLVYDLLLELKAKITKEIAKAIKEKNIPVANLNVNKILAEKENKFEGENAK